MAKRVVLIKHEDSPGDDRAAAWLAEQRFELDWRAPYNGDGLGEPGEEVAGTVLYGGGQSITETDKHPFLKHEFALPAGAVLLAHSELYRHQAFSYGETTYGFQFHPECTRQGFRRWQAADWAPWGQPGAQTREQQDALAAEHDDAQDAWFRDFLGKLFGPAGKAA